jgi:hypothetical protein
LVNLTLPNAARPGRPARNLQHEPQRLLRADQSARLALHLYGREENMEGGLDTGNEMLLFRVARCNIAHTYMFHCLDGVQRPTGFRQNNYFAPTGFRQNVFRYFGRMDFGRIIFAPTGFRQNLFGQNILWQNHFL